MTLINRLRKLVEIYNLGYRTAQLELVRESVPNYDTNRLDKINAHLEQLRKPYIEGGFLERMIHSTGWRKGRKERTKVNWLVANA